MSDRPPPVEVDKTPPPLKKPRAGTGTWLALAAVVLSAWEARAAGRAAFAFSTLPLLPLSLAILLCGAGAIMVRPICGVYLTIFFSVLGDAGKVLAVDVQPEMLKLIEARAKREKVANVVPVLGTEKLIKGMRRDALMGFMKHHYVAGNTVVAWAEKTLVTTTDFVRGKDIVRVPTEQFDAAAELALRCVRTPSDGWATMTNGIAASIVTGLKSLSVSNGIFSYRLALAASAPAAPRPTNTRSTACAAQPGHTSPPRKHCGTTW